MRVGRDILGAIRALGIGLGAAALALGATVVSWQLAAAAIETLTQPAPTDAQFFDLAMAERELGEIQAARSELQTGIAEAQDRIEAMTEARDFLDLNEAARADALFEARADARNMAVAAFINVAPPLAGFDTLDAETAGELTWRNAMLRHQTERLNSAAIDYAERVEQADADLLALSDEINAETRRIEALRRQLSRLTAKVPQAEWYVEIASIHAVASGELESRGRVEPTAEQWRRLRHCESTENYAVDTSNGFFGAYQFTEETWGTVGGDGNPALAPPEEQDARARLLYSQRGAQPWPVCGDYLPG